MQKKRWIRAGQVLAALVMVALTGVFVSGAPSSSTNFSADDMSTPGAAGDADSTNFHISATLPQSVTGQVPSTSTNFVLHTDLVPDTFEPIDTTPPVITAGPTAIYLSDDRALIEWTTDEPASGTADYGLTVAYGSTASQIGGFSALHQVLITGLTANTTYQFQVSSTDAFLNGPTTSANAQFTTLAASNAVAPVFQGATAITFVSISIVQIDWVLDEPSSTDLEWGPTTAMGTTLSDPFFRINNTRTISGLTPGTQYFFDITATDPEGNSSTQGQQSFTMPLAVQITTASLPNGTRGQGYASSIVAINGVGALTFSLDAGTLPPGLVLDGPTGTLSGTPTVTGTYNFDILVTDSGAPASTDVASFTVVIKKKKGGGGDEESCSTGGGQGWMLMLAFGALAALTLRNTRRKA